MVIILKKSKFEIEKENIISINKMEQSSPQKN